MNEFCLRKLDVVQSRNGPVCPNSVLLSKDKPCVVGRAVEGVTLRLISQRTPIMISRKHATVEFRDDLWTITDTGSLNGVFINGRKLIPNVPHPLKVADQIVFGCGVDGQPPEFEYIFQQMGQVKTCKRVWSEGNGTAQKEDQEKSKRICLQKLTDNEPGPSVIQSNNTQQEIENAFDKQIRIKEEKIRQLMNRLLEKEIDNDNLNRKLEKREEILKSEIDKQREELQKEKELEEKKLESLLEQQLKEKESELKDVFERKRMLLTLEKDEIETKLQIEMDKKLSERDMSHREELEKQRELLKKSINDMEIEKKNREEEAVRNQELLDSLRNAKEHEVHLGSCVEELKRQIQEKDSVLQRQQDMQKDAEEVGKRFVLQQMEDEFTCLICHELFVEPLTLPCGHTFCEFCLTAWFRRKDDCPICRDKVHSAFGRSLILHNAVNKMIECADDETKRYRQELINQRKNAKSGAAQERATHEVVHVPDGNSQRNDDVVVIPGPSGIGAQHQQQQGNARANSTTATNNRNQRQNQRRRQFSCYNCGRQGHFRRDCPYLD
eukprot:gene20349-22353_t